MPMKPPRHVAPGARTEADRRKEVDAQRGSSAQRGYGGRWQRLRKAFLSRPENVLCRMCQAEGKTTVANVVDHIRPHRGDPTLMWSESNWQPLCKRHHDGAKKSMEMTGRIKGTDASGRPLDPAHPWNKS